MDLAQLGRERSGMFAGPVQVLGQYRFSLLVAVVVPVGLGPRACAERRLPRGGFGRWCEALSASAGASRVRASTAVGATLTRLTAEFAGAQKAGEEVKQTKPALDKALLETQNQLTELGRRREDGGVGTASFVERERAEAASKISADGSALDRRSGHPVYRRVDGIA